MLVGQATVGILQGVAISAAMGCASHDAGGRHGGVRPVVQTTQPRRTETAAIAASSFPKQNVFGSLTGSVWKAGTASVEDGAHLGATRCQS